MATSEVDVANSSLILMGAERINSLSEDSKEARTMKEELPKMRDEVTGAHPWNFAVDYRSLAQLDEAPEGGFSLSYEIPSDVLRVVKVFDGTVGDVAENTARLARHPWAVKRGKLYCELETVVIEGIHRITTVANWPEYAIQVWAQRLAAQTAYAITQSTTLQANLFSAYNSFFAQARFYDGQEGSTRQVTASDYLDSRA